jgi:hypothetical protein
MLRRFEMIISANQPYFLPFPGFFLKVLLSDIFIILDSVQFPRGTTWITRNRLKYDQGELWMTIPVWKKGLGLQKINEVMICNEGRWPKKYLTSIKNAYQNAPYLKDHLDFIESIFSSEFNKLIDINLAILRYLMEHLRIHTRIMLLSELGIDATGSRLLIEICKKLKVDSFLSQSPTKKNIDANMFKDTNVKLRFINLPHPVYPQLWGDFIPNLSVFDLILNCGPKAHDILTSRLDHLSIN